MHASERYVYKMYFLQTTSTMNNTEIMSEEENRAMRRKIIPILDKYTVKYLTASRWNPMRYLYKRMGEQYAFLLHILHTMP